MQIDKIICENPVRAAKAANCIELLMQWYQRLFYNTLYILDVQLQPEDLEYLNSATLYLTLFISA